MKLYNFDEEEKRMLQSAKKLKQVYDKKKAEKEYNETQNLEIALGLYGKFISDIYPKLITKCLDRYCTAVAKDGNGSFEKNVDDIEFAENFCLYRQIGKEYSIEADEMLYSITLKCNKHFDTDSEIYFIDMLTDFLKRNGCNICNINSDFNKNWTIYINGTYKNLKDAYYMEMQALEYRREALDESKNYIKPKGRN